MSMASMQSEKIRVMDGKDTFEFGAYENTGAKKTYVFNGQTVEETYAGPGKKLNTTRASITLVPIHISRYICRNDVGNSPGLYFISTGPFYLFGCNISKTNFTCNLYQ